MFHLDTLWYWLWSLDHLLAENYMTIERVAFWIPVTVGAAAGALLLRRWIDRRLSA